MTTKVKKSLPDPNSIDGSVERLGRYDIIV